MVAPAVPRRSHVYLGSAAELPRPPDEGGIQQPFLAEVGDEGGGGLVHLGGFGLHGLEVALVRIPPLRIDGDVGDPGLHQPPGHEEGLPEVGLAIALPHLVGFQREIEHLGGIPLDDVPGLPARPVEVGENGRGRVRRPSETVQFVKKFKAVFQFFGGDVAGRNDAVHHEPGGIGLSAGDQRRIFFAQEPHLREAPLGHRQDHVGRQISFVIFGFEHGDHRADGGIDLAAAGDPSGLHEVGGGLMTVVGMGHGANDGVFVRVPGQQRKVFADADPRNVGGDGLVSAVVRFGGIRLGVESLKLAWTAPDPHLDDALRPGGRSLSGGAGGSGLLSEVEPIQTPGGAEKAQGRHGLQNFPSVHDLSAPSFNGGGEILWCSGGSMRGPA